MDRDEIEDVVHASLGRHLRVTCVLGLLFLVVGFVLGHYVAAQHARLLSDRWSDRATELSKQIGQIDAKLKTRTAEVRQPTKANPVTLPTPASPTVDLSQLSRHEELLGETRRLARATEDLRRSLIARCIEDSEREKARILGELKPYLDRKLAINAVEVSEAVNRLVDTQVAQLKTLAQVELPMAPSAEASISLKSEISPVSGEPDPASCPEPMNTPLVPVAEVQTPATQESAALMPMPRTPLFRMPVQAEPTSHRPIEKGAPSQFFTAPRQPRLFIPARKTLEVSKAPEPVIR